ncbi:hypothetical protein F5B22DRAFT_650307 [Xylaria bambusicola]|uniref:uncharacterized protein n=1 Tax=Xylaria bambusicola TaxID=326684 RepID=UPI002007818E|nr:uncharacterized protein F5B22DRAFT_650307 [Xylaria bambusicola]KAI0506826.1 hypothetical protein F5B22DRAFT_650307 [Xylaria bambusicola]
MSARDGFPGDKRKTSLSNFISKILPSHRPEQGGTVRGPHVTNDSDSAYLDLGMNPNDLTEWNLAQDPPVTPPPPEQIANSQQHMNKNPSTQRGRSRLRDKLIQPSRIPRRTPGPDFALPQKSLEDPQALESSSRVWRQRDKSQPITTGEIHDALKTKEARRKSRRSLKESGDWLGVQGADPYSGEFAVLTPTSTLSSETTPPSAKFRLAQLSERRRGAIAAYEEARLEEQAETEKILLQKGRSRLEKMEHAKEQRRQMQQRFPTWSQHRRRWSSVHDHEPVLSPIPQSLKSNKVDGSSDEALPIVSVRNFSRPSKSTGGSAVGESENVVHPGGSENIGSSKHDRRKSRSTETVIRQVLPKMKRSAIPTKSAKIHYHPVFSETSDSPLDEQNKEKHFLWRRHRRMSDPGKQRKRSKALMIHSSARKTEENLAFTFVDNPPPLPRLYTQKPKDHFQNLPIPDHRLNLLPYVEQFMAMKRSSIRTETDLLPVTSLSPVQDQSRPTLRLATNLSAFQESQTDPQSSISDAKGATAISFPSKPRGNTTPPPNFRRVIPLRSSSFQAGVLTTQESQIHIQTTRATQSHSDLNLPKNTTGPQSLHHQPSLQEPLRSEIPEDHIGINMSDHRERDRGESVSTPTIIITGFDHHQQLLSKGIQSQMECQKNQKSNIVEEDREVVILNYHDDEPAPQKQGRQITSSLPTVPQNDLQNFVLAHETAEIGTVSAGLAIKEIDSTHMTQYKGQHDLYQSPGDLPTKHTSKEVHESPIVHPQQHHDTSEDQSTQTDDTDTEVTDYMHHDQSNKARTTRRRQGPGELTEAMIQEAARIAMQRSRAREIVTRSRTPSRTPSPRTTTTATTATKETRADAGSPLNGGESGVTGVLSSCDMDLRKKIESVEKRKRTVQSTKTKEQETRTIGIVNKAGTANGAVKGDGKENGNAYVLVLVSLVIVAYMILLGLASAWWVVVQPAFDTRSELWRRKRRGQTTGEDVGVFVAAGAFCVGGVLVLGGLVRGVVWVMGA